MDPVPDPLPAPLHPRRNVALQAEMSSVERVAGWAGHRVDHVIKRVLRGLFSRKGVPLLTPEELERSLALLDCYTNPAALADPDVLMPASPKLANLTLRSRRPVRGGTHAHLTFKTPYRPVHQLYAAEYARYDRLDDVHLFAWQHTRPAPASVLITHGWGLGNKRVHEIEFGIDLFFRRLGLDIYYYVAPFHWIRRPSRTRYSGELHPSPNLMRTNEAFIQTARELRSIIGYIKRYNEAPLGMMGSSLGGYTTALLASIDDRLDFAVPVLPPASLAELFWRQGEGDPMRKRAEGMGMNLQRFREAWALHSPLSYQPRVPWRARLIVSASGDAIVPASAVEPLWHHWARPRHHVFAGGHVLQIFARQYHREVAGLLGELKLVSPRRLARAGIPLRG